MAQKVGGLTNLPEQVQSTSGKEKTFPANLEIKTIKIDRRLSACRPMPLSRCYNLTAPLPALFLLRLFDAHLGGPRPIPLK